MGCSQAFIETIKTVQVQNEDTPLEVSTIENKGDGVFVVKKKQGGTVINGLATYICVNICTTGG